MSGDSDTSELKPGATSSCARYSADGTTLLSYGGQACSFEVDARCRAIADGAFEGAPLQEVVLPDGLEHIGANAFKNCDRLVRADFPRTLRSLGDAAFFGTALDAIHIPAALASIGTAALATCSDVPGGTGSKTASITVDPENTVFSVRGNVLMEALPAGGYSAVAFFGDAPEVVLGDDVVAVAPYALNGAAIRSLVVSDRIGSIGTCGVAVHGPLRALRINFASPSEGHDHIAFDYPEHEESQHFVLRILRQGSIDAQTVVDTYDEMLASEVYDPDRSLRILARLTDPFLMKPAMKRKLDRLVKVRFGAIVATFVRNDQHEGFEMLADMGYLHADNIADVIDAAGKADNVALTGFLLELQRRRFAPASSLMGDFEL